ncbi:Tat pathway signal protein [bacterium]|nr:MAG: Tat pathway signal protein [bacterium]
MKTFLKSLFKSHAEKALLAIMLISLSVSLNACNTSNAKKQVAPSQIDINSDEMKQFMSDLKKRTFTYFWDVVDTVNFQTDDRYPSRTFTSIAATGFALPAYIIGVENQYISREQAAERTLAMLSWLWKSKQSTDEHGATGYKGFYYHFLNFGSGTRFKDVELSTIDTGLLMAGILTAQSYFDADNTKEAQIRDLADKLYLRVEWNWAMNGNRTMSMGWRPEKGFISSQWKGYNEAMVLVVMAMGSPTYPISDDSWNAWTETYHWEAFQGYEHLNFGPLFGHQYSQMFIDFKGIQDAYMKDKGIDYFENSRRATLSQQAYAANNPLGFVGYSSNMWGLTASDGPNNVEKMINGKSVRFRTYSARGAAEDYLEDDGTLVPTAAGGSIPFAPEQTLETLYEMKNRFGDKVYREYGFIDAFNLTYQENGWFNDDYIGIDQGPIIIQLENYQTGLIWNILKKNKYIVSGLKKAGFTGGWLKNDLNN